MGPARPFAWLRVWIASLRSLAQPIIIIIPVNGHNSKKAGASEQPGMGRTTRASLGKEEEEESGGTFDYNVRRREGEGGALA